MSPPSLAPPLAMPCPRATVNLVCSHDLPCIASCEPIHKPRHACNRLPYSPLGKLGGCLWALPLVCIRFGLHRVAGGYVAGAQRASGQ